MKIRYKILSVIAVMAIVVSCDLNRDLDNPNEVGINAANPDLIMNKIQADFGLFFAKVSEPNVRNVSELVRMRAMTGANTYKRAFSPPEQNGVWEDAYQKILVNIDAMIPLATASQQNVHLGVAKILKAYVYLTLVDIFGDVPYSQALKGDEGIFNPEVDGGASIYAASIALLAEARTDLANTAGSGLARDIYYNGDRAKWKTLANSLELKAQLNLAAKASNATAVAAIDALIAANDLIDTDAEEFTYKYGTSQIPAISRSPLYQSSYSINGGTGPYLGNYFMFQMYRDPNLGVQDPRWRYYFYRQAGSRTQMLKDDNQSVPCAFNSAPDHYVAEGQPYCTFEPGFYGRDHGNADGSPADGNAKTAAGVYPAGGRIDLNDGNPNYSDKTRLGQGGNGAGIEPIYMSWFTDFMKAEVALRIKSDPAAAKELMLSGVKKSITRVRSFSNALGQSLPAGLEPSEVTYTATLGAFYDIAADQLDVISKEYYKSLWGNALEAYNLYRRTGSPKMMQPTRSPEGDEGGFVYSMFYPANFVNLNGSVEQKPDNSTRVFWDVNGFELR